MKRPTFASTPSSTAVPVDAPLTEPLPAAPPEASIDDGRRGHAGAAVHAPRVAYVLLVGLALVWGGHWVVSKVGLRDMAPFTYGSLRAATGALTLMVLLAARGELRRPPREDLPIVVSVGLVQIAAGIALMNLALQAVPAGRSSVLVFTMPLWVAVDMAVIFRIRPNRFEAGGLALGMIGIVTLLNPAAVDWGSEGELIGSAGLLLSAMLWALVTIHVRHHRWHASPIDLQPWQLCVALVPLLALAVTLEPGLPVQWSVGTVLVILYSGPLASAFAYWASQSIIRSLGPITASTGMLSVPVVGLVTGSVALGERITPLDVAGFAAVLAGVALASRSPRVAPSPGEPMLAEV